jgi:hypothetical protein
MVLYGVFMTLLVSFWIGIVLYQSQRKYNYDHSNLDEIMSDDELQNYF